MTSLGQARACHARDGADEAQWKELGRVMPKKIISNQAGYDRKRVRDAASLATKRVRLFNNEIVVWGNHELPQQQEKLHQLEAKFSKMRQGSHVDLLDLRVFLRQVTAALSAPRPWP